MPYVMSLEGPRLNGATGFFGELADGVGNAASSARAFVQKPIPALYGVFDPLTTPIVGANNTGLGSHPWILIGGILFGGWLAGAAGQKALASWGIGSKKRGQLSGDRHKRRRR